MYNLATMLPIAIAVALQHRTYVPPDREPELAFLRSPRIASTPFDMSPRVMEGKGGKERFPCWRYRTTMRSKELAAYLKTSLHASTGWSLTVTNIRVNAAHAKNGKVDWHVWTSDGVITLSNDLRAFK